ncbi:MAG: VWA domain-containing protein [Hyphomicrobiaceae bacterium]|nr:VWA domain-containing protein [Hyphomicrobiaceae bacterium]
MAGALRASLRCFAGHCRRFERDEEGVVAIVLALTISAVLFLAAIAIDDSRFTSEWMKDQYALDAALLAASDTMGLPEEQAEARARAEAYYIANRPAGSPVDLVDVKLNTDEGSVDGSTRFDWKSTLLRAFGYEQMRLGSNSRVVRGGTAEIALVLDNSGSMRNDIGALRAAAADLANVVFAGAETSDQVSLAVIPFAASVNVGSGQRGAAWIDNEGVSPISRENAIDDRSRFQLFDDVGETWKGCVEMRPVPYDVDDTLPDDGNPSTIFVPMFAPDEPDSINAAGKSYSNSYLVDDGGNCPKQECNCIKFKSNGKCRGSESKYWKLTPIPPTEAQARTCKYAGEQVGYGSPPGDNCARPALNGAGPNAACTTLPMLPLSSTRADVIGTIDQMQANGTTNIGEAVGWGLRALSPSVPFTEGRAYDEPENKKIMIVMTDGANHYTDANNHNESIYAGLGYAKPYRTPSSGRLGTTYTFNAYVARMTARTRVACSNAKAQGIKVYTIAFRLEDDPATMSLLRDCASETRDAYAASDGATLIETFRNIGREISSLRVAN